MPIAFALAIISEKSDEAMAIVIKFLLDFLRVSVKVDWAAVDENVEFVSPLGV